MGEGGRERVREGEGEREREVETERLWCCWCPPPSGWLLLLLWELSVQRHRSLSAQTRQQPLDNWHRWATQRPLYGSFIYTFTVGTVQSELMKSCCGLGLQVCEPQCATHSRYVIPGSNPQPAPLIYLSKCYSVPQ